MTAAWWLLVLFAGGAGAAGVWRLTVGRRRDMVDREHVARAVAAGDDPVVVLAYDVPLSYPECRAIVRVVQVLVDQVLDAAEGRPLDPVVGRLVGDAAAYVALLKARLDAPRPVDGA